MVDNVVFPSWSLLALDTFFWLAMDERGPGAKMAANLGTSVLPKHVQTETSQSVYTKSRGQHNTK